MTAEESFWERAVRKHDRQVFLSLLSMGVGPDKARDLTQATWAKLLEKNEHGSLEELRLPGLAIKQARFLALNEFRKTQTEERALKVVEGPSGEVDVESAVIGRQTLEAALDALDSCSPQAKRIFRLVYGIPPHSHTDAAREVGLSLQRVRQVICETRQHIRTALAERSSR